MAEREVWDAEEEPMVGEGERLVMEAGLVLCKRELEHGDEDILMMLVESTAKHTCGRCSNQPPNAYKDRHVRRILKVARNIRK